VIKGYADQRVQLPLIWLFYDNTIQPGFSEINKEWLGSIPGMKQYDEGLLEAFCTLPASVTDPVAEAVKLPFEHYRNSKIRE